jgi:hypothetical protein
MEIHPHAAAAERDSFGLKAEALVQAILAGQGNASSGGDHAMPRQSASTSQRPNCLAGGAGESGGLGYIPIRDDSSPRDACDYRSHQSEHRGRRRLDGQV